MYNVFLILHVLFCIALVAVVLLQVGRGRGMLGALGGGTAETLFGSQAGNVLTKGTTVVAIMFMITSLSLAYLSVKKGETVMKGVGIGSSVTLPEATDSSASESAAMKKGSKAVEDMKNRLLGKIPNLTPTTTTKSSITYDEKGNKVSDDLQYDADGKLIGHSKTTSDRTGKEIAKEELPLEELPAEEPKASEKVQE